MYVYPFPVAEAIYCLRSKFNELCFPQSRRTTFIVAKPPDWSTTLMKESMQKKVGPKADFFVRKQQVLIVANRATAGGRRAPAVAPKRGGGGELATRGGRRAMRHQEIA